MVIKFLPTERLQVLVSLLTPGKIGEQRRRAGSNCGDPGEMGGRGQSQMPSNSPLQERDCSETELECTGEQSIYVSLMCPVKCMIVIIRVCHTD